MAKSERDLRRAEFVRNAGWGDAGERLLAGDASFRKYFRLSRPRSSAVVMDAPPPQEDVRPFVRIGRHLISLGLSAPEILAEDTEHGCLLLEDFGDATHAALLDAGAAAPALTEPNAPSALSNTKGMNRCRRVRFIWPRECDAVGRSEFRRRWWR